MRAKHINENVSDILKPKNEDDINRSIADKVIDLINNLEVYSFDNLSNPFNNLKRSLMSAVIAKEMAKKLNAEFVYPGSIKVGKYILKFHNYGDNEWAAFLITPSQRAVEKDSTKYKRNINTLHKEVVEMLKRNKIKWN